MNDSNKIEQLQAAMKYGSSFNLKVLSIMKRHTLLDIQTSMLN